MTKFISLGLAAVMLAFVAANVVNVHAQTVSPSPTPTPSATPAGAPNTGFGG